MREPNPVQTGDGLNLQHLQPKRAMRNRSGGLLTEKCTRSEITCLHQRFVLPRDNVPNKRRKQLREQFMRRTRLVLKESEHEPWCKRYIELYQELGENWERLYWDEGYSTKIAQDHANYDSAEDDENDFNPFRSRPSEQMKDQGFVRNRQVDMREKVSQIRDKFEYDRERRMREKAFAPMNREMPSELPDHFQNQHHHFQNQPFDAQRYFPEQRN